MRYTQLSTSVTGKHNITHNSHQCQHDTFFSNKGKRLDLLIGNILTSQAFDLSATFRSFTNSCCLNRTQPSKTEQRQTFKGMFLNCTSTMVAPHDCASVVFPRRISAVVNDLVEMGCWLEESMDDLCCSYQESDKFRRKEIFVQAG